MINFTILFSSLKTFKELKEFFNNFISSFDNIDDKNFNFLFLYSKDDILNMDDSFKKDLISNYKNNFIDVFLNYVYLHIPEKNVFFEIIPYDTYKHSDINFYTCKNNIDVITFFIKDNVKFLPESKGKWYNVMLDNLKGDKDFVSVGYDEVNILNNVYKLPRFDCVLFKSFIYGLNEYFDHNYFTLKYAEYDFFYRIMHNQTNFYFLDEKDVHIEIDKNRYLYSSSDEERDKNRLNLKFSLSGERINNYRNGNIRGYEYVRYNFLISKIKELVENNKFKPKILELGCGIPFYLDKIKDYIAEYRGIDYEDNVIEFNKIEFYDLSMVSFEKGDITNIEYLSSIADKYDVIIAYEILEHIDNMEDVLSFLVNTGKILFLSVPYNEKKETGFIHHKHFNLKEDVFLKHSNKIKIFYQTRDCSLYPDYKKEILDEDTIKTMIGYLYNEDMFGQLYIIRLYNELDIDYLRIFFLLNSNKNISSIYIYCPVYLKSKVRELVKEFDLVNVYLNDYSILINNDFVNVDLVILPNYLKK